MAARVKICGVTRPEDAVAAARFGADMIGINFYPQSPRFVTLERAREIRDALAARCALVGVFVNAERECVEERRAELSLDFLQFHGDEDEAALRGWKVPVIRAMRLRLGEAPGALGSVSADYILLDSFDSGRYGGTGRRLNLDHLRGFDLSRVFISGGLTAGNVAEAAALSPYAVDVASGVESAPGLKDHLKLRSFIENAKAS